MRKETIFVALSTFAEYDPMPLKILESSGHPFSLNTLGKRLNKEQVLELARGSAGIIAGIETYDSDVLERLPGLRCISRCGVGTDNIDKTKAEELGISIVNTPDVVVQPVAELTVAMVFDLLRKLSYHTSLMRSKRWEKKAGHLLSGKRVGVIGLGRIGKRVCELMLKLDAVVCGTDIAPDLEWASRTGVDIVSLEGLLKSSDIVTIHTSILKDNSLRLDAKGLSLMKEGAFLVNTSRGQLIDESALYDALSEGRLGGAALDVFSVEPYAGKLCDLDNVVLTPHVATLTKESRVLMEAESVKNILSALKPVRA